LTKAVKQSTSKTKSKKVKFESFNNNEPDYESDLYFEPKMTWTDFIKWCDDKNIAYKLDKNMFGNYVLIDCIEFYESGKVKVKDTVGSLAHNLSFERFKELISILKGL